LVNFRDKLAELNEQMAKFDDLQTLVEDSEAALESAKFGRDQALDTIHTLTRALNSMLPGRPDEEGSPPQAMSSSGW
jgi:hypothetical protein